MKSFSVSSEKTQNLTQFRLKFVRFANSTTHLNMNVQFSPYSIELRYQTNISTNKFAELNGSTWLPAVTCFWKGFKRHSMQTKCKLPWNSGQLTQKFSIFLLKFMNSENKSFIVYRFLLESIFYDRFEFDFHSNYRHIRSWFHSFELVKFR